MAFPSVASLVYVLGFAGKLRPYRLKWSVKSLRLSVRNIGYQCRIGSSALLTELTMAMLMFVGNHVFMQYLGGDGVGAFSIACYYTPFVFMVGNAIAQSAQPIISYNFGLGRGDRVSATERIALFTSVACGLVITAAFTLFPQRSGRPVHKYRQSGRALGNGRLSVFLYGVCVLHPEPFGHRLLPEHRKGKAGYSAGLA